MVTLIVDMITAPADWRWQLQHLGVVYRGYKPQPIADQIMLTGCTGVPDKLPLPAWLREPDPKRRRRWWWADGVMWERCKRAAIERAAGL